MKILVKIPSRERPLQCLQRVELMQKMQISKDVGYLISCDHKDKHYQIPGAVIIYGKSKNKVEAYNRDIPKTGWDILIVSSDDMVCMKHGWDAIIAGTMEKNFPDTDGVLWFNDGYVGNKLNTMPIIGRKRYKKFGYVYHPAYNSLWCDNEFMEVNNDKQIYFSTILFKHEHPAWNKNIRRDALYDRNESFYQSDKIIYESRKRQGFPA